MSDARAAVIAAIGADRSFVLATHEQPDGDALGSLAAMQQTLLALGKDSVAYVSADELPFPYEYGRIEIPRLATDVPADIGERTAIFLDCGNIDRNPAAALRSAVKIINIDHHHDNTMFGTIDLVLSDYSSTAEVLWELLPQLGAQPTPAIAEALYVGLVTDTGRFMYDNTSPRTHDAAGDLIAAGVDVHAVYRRLFEGVPLGKLDLMARGLAAAQSFDGGVLTLSQVTRSDYEDTGAEDSHSEGLVDFLRSVRGTAVAGLIREIAAENGSPLRRKVSLRAADDRVDVSVIARAQGGGGHRRAAGFTTELDFDELVAFLRQGVAAQLCACPTSATEF